MFTMFNFSERSTSQHCCSQIQNMSKLFATSNYQIRFRELILNQDFFARALQKGPGCICYIFILSLFCIRRSKSNSQDVSVKFLDLQNLQSVSWHLEFRKVFCRTFDGWIQWLCTFSGKHGVYQHTQLYFMISNQSYWLSWSLGRVPIPKYWHYSNSYPTHPADKKSTNPKYSSLSLWSRTTICMRGLWALWCTKQFITCG